MIDSSSVHVTVLEPALVDEPPLRTGSCRLVVESARALPAAPYAGTVRVGATEETLRGFYPTRLLKHFAVEPVDVGPGRAIYALSVDLSDEWPGPPPGDYVPPGYRPRRVAESVETVCKRIAGIFGRHCEQYRAPSVSVRLDQP